MQPYAFLWEEEIGATGELIPTATVFLTNRECPFHCLMCDLWRNTLDERVQSGAIPTQIRFALERLPLARQIKLYNSGNFFDPQAIPPEDYDEIAEVINDFERVIVECHPALLRADRLLQFCSSLSGKLEVAIGLETSHQRALNYLNKRMTIDDFRRAAEFLMRNEISLRTFILLKPPSLDEVEGLQWACCSLELAMECGATACSIIPTRGGNGAMEALGESFTPPRLTSLEAAQEYGLKLGRGRVFADLWDADNFCDCECSSHRIRRLDLMNRTQLIPDPIICANCKTRED